MTTIQLPIPDKPAWDGPFEETGGITQSQMTRFCANPFTYYLYAVLGLEEPEALDNRLIWGDTLHKGLEHLIRGDMLESSIQTMKDYRIKNYPGAPRTYDATTSRMLKLYQEVALPNLQTYGTLETERHLKERLTLEWKIPLDMHLVRNFISQNICDPLTFTSSNKQLYRLVDMVYDVWFRGKTDVTNIPTTMLCDHKGKGTLWSSPETVKKELGQDVQMNLYAKLLGGVETWYYDLILIPEEAYRVPQLRQGENPEEYADRLFYTYRDIMNGFPIAKCWGKWINQVPYFQPKEANDRFFIQTIMPIVLRMINWWNLVTTDIFDPNNNYWYNHIFYKSPIRMFDAARTPKFKCDYHSILIDEQTFEYLKPVKSFYPELEHTNA